MYDPATGVFTWCVSRNRQPKDSLAGTKTYHGYTAIKVDGVTYRAHRLAWLYVYGEWPTAELDHVNRIRNDNRIANLRLTTRFLNMQNLEKVGMCSKHVGVSRYQDKIRWRAYITVKGKQINLGIFNTENEALNARKLAEVAYYADHALQR
jgi:hypothetical protein